jgi:DNA-binding response OmpR family regulator
MKVVIADDSDLLRKNVRKLVKRTITPVEIAESGTIAATMGLLTGYTPDIIILDLKFPDGTAYEVLRYLQHGSRRPTVIILTNYAGSVERQKSLELGADYFFDKTNEFESAGTLLSQIARM